MTQFKEAAESFVKRYMDEDCSGTHTFNITKANPHYASLLDEVKVKGTVDIDAGIIGKESWTCSVTKSGFMLKVAVTPKEAIFPDATDEVINYISKLYAEDGMKGYAVYSISSATKNFDAVMKQFDEAGAYAFIVDTKSANTGIVRFSTYKDLIRIELNYDLKSSVPKDQLEKMTLAASRIVGPDCGLKFYTNAVLSANKELDKKVTVLGLGNLFGVSGFEIQDTEAFAKALQLIAPNFYDKGLSLEDVYNVIGYVQPKEEPVTFQSWRNSVDSEAVKSLSVKYPILQYVPMQDVPEQAWELIFAEEMK